VLLAVSCLSADRQLSSGDPRPLADALMQLERRYGWQTTYEDPPYEHPEDLMDVVPASVKAVNPKARHLVPKGKSISITYKEPDDPQSVLERRATIEHVVKEFSSKGAGFFRVVHNGPWSNVVPTAVRRANGQIDAFQPVFDTRVSFPAAQRTIAETFSLIRAQIASKRGIQIRDGTIPINMFLSRQYLTDANDEKACDVLMRVFNDANGWMLGMGIPAPVAWRLFWDPTEKAYYFNAYVINQPPTPSNRPKVSEGGKGNPQKP
jgi:hypothetical protein